MPDDTDPILLRDETDDDRFPRLADVEYDRVNAFLREHVSFTAREWAIARLCADFRTKTGVEMTKIGANLPDLVPFMPEPYTPQAVYQARRSFHKKVRTAGATFLYGAYADFLTADEVDDVIYEATEVAKFLLEVEGAPLSYERERAVETTVKDAMASVHEASLTVRYDRCPHCGERLAGSS